MDIFSKVMVTQGQAGARVLKQVVQKIRPGHAATQTKAVPLKYRAIRWAVFSGTVLALSAGIYHEVRESSLQAAFFSTLAGKLQWVVQDGANDELWLPPAAPYDSRLGYSRMRDILPRLTGAGYEVIAQARQSEEFLETVSRGFYPIYREKTQAGLRLLDRNGAAVLYSRFPQRLYVTFDDIPPVLAHQGRLEAAFHNLLSNAIQAMTRQGGQIRLSVRYPVEGMVAITVADTGPGIPPELQERIFNPGVSGKAGSLGIGLWLVETFIHQFNGRIEFTSAATGATFTVYLPPVGSNPALPLNFHR